MHQRKINIVLLFLFTINLANIIQVQGRDSYRIKLDLVIVDYNTNTTKALSTCNETLSPYPFLDHISNKKGFRFLNYHLSLLNKKLYFKEGNHSLSLDLVNFQTNNFSSISVPINTIYHDFNDSLEEDIELFPLVHENNSIYYYFSALNFENYSVRDLIVVEFASNSTLIRNYTYTLAFGGPNSVSGTIVNDETLNFVITYYSDEESNYPYAGEAILFDPLTSTFRSYVYSAPDFFDILFEYNDQLYIIRGDKPELKIERVLSNGTQAVVLRDYSISYIGREQIIIYQDKLLVTNSVINQTLDKTITTISIFNLPTVALEQRYHYDHPYKFCNLEDPTVFDTPSVLRNFYFDEGLKVHKTAEALYLCDDFNLMTYNKETEEITNFKTQEFYSCFNNVKIASLPVNETSEVVLKATTVEKVTTKAVSTSLQLYFAFLGILVFSLICNYKKKIMR